MKQVSNSNNLKIRAQKANKYYPIATSAISPKIFSGSMRRYATTFVLKRLLIYYFAYSVNFLLYFLIESVENSRRVDWLVTSFIYIDQSKGFTNEN